VWRSHSWPPTPRNKETKSQSGSSLPTTQPYAWATPGNKLVTVTGQGNCVGSASVTVNVTANAAPAVTLTGPANGSSYFAPASVPLSATASDSDGTINRVEFWTTTGTAIGTVTASPYNVTWSNVGVGTYTVFARAYDDLGAHTDSAGSTITVNNPGQVTGISVSSPRTLGQASSATVSGSNPCGAVTINWGDGTVITYPISSLPTTQSHAWTASGNRTVTATGQGNCSGTASTTINVNAPPTVSITGPINGSTFVAPASFDITASASDPDSGVQRVDFYANGSFLGSDTTAPYSFSWGNVGAGTYGLQAVAVDNLGVATTSGTVTVTVNNAGPSQVTSIQLVPAQPVIGTNTTVNVFGTNPCGAVQINYGDGTVIVYPITGLPFSQVHVWNSPGSITVTATGMGNCAGQVSKTTSVVP
jgi:Bacterial Ig domain